MVAQGELSVLPATAGQSVSQERIKTSQQRRRARRVGHELSKTGMIASLTVIALTGFRVLKPMMPLHPMAGLAFIGFALWHVYQKDQRAAYTEAVQPSRVEDR
ncbi:MAG: hypothetical protein HQL80_06860 [Magnetococcales bacterium]|nr:hypothetical protein [Magnetococcales bacterium]